MIWYYDSQHTRRLGNTDWAEASRMKTAHGFHLQPIHMRDIRDSRDNRNERTWRICRNKRTRKVFPLYIGHEDGSLYSGVQLIAYSD